MCSRSREDEGEKISRSILYNKKEICRNPKPTDEKLKEIRRRIRKFFPHFSKGKYEMIELDLERIELKLKKMVSNNADLPEKE